MFYFINYSFIHFTYVGPMLIAVFVTEIVFHKYVYLFIIIIISVIVIVVVIVTAIVDFRAFDLAY